MTLFEEEHALACFKGEIPEDERGYVPRMEAYEWLKDISGKDFGFNLEAWTAWVNEQMAKRPPKV